MKNLIANIVCASPEIVVANVPVNSGRIIEAIKSAESECAAIITLPELAICGYTCGDIFHNQTLLEEVERNLVLIREASAGKNILILLGTPAHDAHGRLLDGAMVIQDGHFIAFIPKTNYAASYTRRWFSGGMSPAINTIEVYGTSVLCGQPLLLKDRKTGVKIGVTIGDDDNTVIPTSLVLSGCGAEIVLNISAEPFFIDSMERRTEDIRKLSEFGRFAYIYNSGSVGESTTDAVYSSLKCGYLDGDTLDISPELEAISTKPLTIAVDLESLRYERHHLPEFFNPKLSVCTPATTVDVFLNTSVRREEPLIPTEPFLCGMDKSIVCRRIAAMQQRAILKKLDYMGRKKTIIGVSGGLDSTVALLALVDAYRGTGRSLTDIIGVTMPGPGTSEPTYQNAKHLMDVCQIKSMEIPITTSVEANLRAIGQPDKLYDITYEQTQSRARTRILMDLANMENGVVVGTGDLSELALGWMSYSGDQISMYALNAGIPKTIIHHMADWYRENAPGQLKEVLSNIVAAPISPELLPLNEDGKQRQETEELVGPYIVHDFFLYYLLKYNYGLRKILEMAKQAFKGIYSDGDLRKWMDIFAGRFFSRQYKRTCFPDGLQVYDVSLSPRTAWMMPSDASNQIWKSELEEG